MQFDNEKDWKTKIKKCYLDSVGKSNFQEYFSWYLVQIIQWNFFDVSNELFSWLWRLMIEFDQDIINPKYAWNKTEKPLSP